MAGVRFWAILFVAFLPNAGASCPEEIANEQVVQGLFGRRPKFQVAPAAQRPATESFRAKISVLSEGTPVVFLNRFDCAMVEGTVSNVDGPLLILNRPAGPPAHIRIDDIPIWSFRVLAKVENAPRRRLAGSSVPIEKQIGEGTTVHDPKLGTLQHFGGVPEFHMKLIEEAGLQFSPPTAPTPDGVTYRTTQVFDDNGREAALVLVNLRGQQFLRVFQKSKSAGAFRLMAAVERDAFSSHWSKGVGDIALAAPLSLTTLLDQAPRIALAEKWVDPIVTGGVTMTDPDWGHPIYRAHPQSIFKKLEIRPVLSDVERPLAIDMRFWFSREKPKTYARPQTLTFKDPANAPDWSKLVSKSEARNQLTMKMEAVERYSSRDGHLIYTIRRDYKDRIYLQSCEDLRAPINDFGVRAWTPDLRELAMPLIEYVRQVPKEYLFQTSDKYSFTWNYLREIPTIAEYYQVRGIPMPPRK